MPLEQNYNLLPAHMRQSMKSYIEDGVPVGDFLKLIICNDFVHAACHADDINQECLLNYAKFLYMEAPSGCWGDEETYHNWIERARHAREGSRMD